MEGSLESVHVVEPVEQGFFVGSDVDPSATTKIPHHRRLMIVAVVSQILFSPTHGLLEQPSRVGGPSQKALRWDLPDRAPDRQADALARAPARTESNMKWCLRCSLT